MTTTLKRYQLSEIPELKSALGVARSVWPDETSTTKLIYRLASVGAQHLSADPSVSRVARLAKLEALTGRYPSTLDTEYLEELRREWEQ